MKDDESERKKEVNPVPKSAFKSVWPSDLEFFKRLVLFVLDTAIPGEKNFMLLTTGK